MFYRARNAVRTVKNEALTMLTSDPRDIVVDAAAGQALIGPQAWARNLLRTQKARERTPHHIDRRARVSRGP
eukprot:5682886-Pyramimonas_sp.AAC.1